jgi:menaquinone-dependent protoporphyrinogen oxidase
MASGRILVVYGTKYGQTEKIARYIGNRLLEAKRALTLMNGDAVPRELSLDAFDGVIVGASIIVGKHQRSIRSFVREHRDVINTLPSAFFSVSGSAASKSETGRNEATRMLSAFLSETGWRPRLTRTIGGAMAFRRYNPLVRWMMKRISAKEGGPIDTSRDHELTDWTQVDRFVDDFVSLLPQRTDSHLDRGANVGVARSNLTDRVDELAVGDALQ